VLEGINGTIARDSMVIEDDQQRAMFGLPSGSRLRTLITQRWRMTIAQRRTGVAWQRILTRLNDRKHTHYRSNKKDHARPPLPAAPYLIGRALRVEIARNKASSGFKFAKTAPMLPRGGYVRSERGSRNPKAPGRSSARRRRIGAVKARLLSPSHVDTLDVPATQSRSF
jgi:hypothetical protein